MNDSLLIDKKGWLKPNRWINHVVSPNFNERPNKLNIDLLVIHHITLPPNHFGGDSVQNFFTNQLDTNQHSFYQEIKHLKVSAHLFIKRNGEVIQFVSFNKRAWHAGESSFQGRVDCNNFSIGIELEGSMTTPYRYGQYKALKQVIFTIKKNYPIKSISGHSDISPNRKADPGPYFDWNQIKSI